MDAVEDLPGLVQPAGRAIGEIDEGVAARPIDAREPEDGEGNVTLIRQFLPALFCLDALYRACRYRMAWSRLIHPGACMIAIDADGRQVTDPLQFRHGVADG